MSRLVRAPEIAELKAFCAAADLGSLGKAARLLGMSQPALSKRLRALEGLIGTELFTRSSSGVSLTKAGQELYAESLKLLAQAEVVERLVQGMNSTEPSVRLALSHTIYESLLTQLLADYPDDERLKVEVVASNSRSAERMVRDGRAELAIVALDPSSDYSELETTTIREDEVVIGVPERHNWSGYEEIPRGRFLEEPLVMRDPQANTRRVVEHVLAEQGLNLAEPLLELGSTPALRAAAVRRNAPALLSKMAIDGHSSHPALAMRRVKGLRFPRSFAVITASSESLSAPAHRLHQHLASG